ncbi:5-methylcytosine-specific restriction enzyme subunit McrC [Flavobacterium flevense]|uniref:Restriction endonuclease n=1 Tax=Flavobacterium flevense TaxID=983 RepID=A0A4Y4AXR5_9FLAO|nr:hypothetical protein [Flavobacterium flevense]GEC73018.1 hypothetical protein FFL01_25570 [Flavobacterium flevense]SHM19014.1 5-methylcytosine-specific restriction enzyme subunit McrC [Flavobacterium flevense]
MLQISEHFEFYNRNHLSTFKEVTNWENYYIDSVKEDRIDFLNDKDRNCVIVSLLKQDQSEVYTCNIQSSYYIGLDRFPKLNLNVYVEPKLNDATIKLDYISMLLEALKAPENFKHLDGLIETKLKEDWIEIKSDLKPILTPFLIAQFLSVVKDLVKKGLKKSYYTVQENLNSRVKGKILVGQQIKQNLLKNRLTKTICQYQEFGFDTEANQFLKYVLSVIPNLLTDFNQEKQFGQLQEVLHYCNGGFYQVSNRDFEKLKYKENNTFYRNYNQAIKLGNQILALQDYNISCQNQQETTKHPPFWIDMSKLFELYVFKQLKQQFPEEGQVKYHEKRNRQELDFIINTPNIKAVVDAKYKPRYSSGNPSMDDARQLSGYTRLNSVYRELGITDNTIIPAYFIYPANLQTNTLDDLENIEMDLLEEITFDSKIILESDLRKSSTYREMFLQELKLPTNLI